MRYAPASTSAAFLDTNPTAEAILAQTIRDVAIMTGALQIRFDQFNRFELAGYDSEFSRPAGVRREQKAFDAFVASLVPSQTIGELIAECEAEAREGRAALAAFDREAALNRAIDTLEAEGRARGMSVRDLLLEAAS